MVVVGTGGVVSLRPVLAALDAGKVVATANKETLVAGGHLVMPLARARADERRAGRDPRDPLASPLGWLRPIDSEHSAIWQCLAGETLARVDRLIITASGGPFLDTPAEAFATITPEQALRHPTWTMGAKITIDSATLANKGLEVIEARWLYDVDYEHDRRRDPSAVGRPLRRPVRGRLTEGTAGHARHATPDPVRADVSRSPALAGRRARPGRLGAPGLPRAGLSPLPGPAHRPRGGPASGPRATAALIAADDVAVARFLDGSLDFPGIPRLLEAAVDAIRRQRGGAHDPDLDELVALDAEVRAAFAGRRATGSPGLMDGLLFAIVAIVLFVVVLGGLVLSTSSATTSPPGSNVRVLEFGFGFPPRAKVLRSKGETLWTLNWLPIGGFVRMEGEDGDAADDPRSFSAKPLGCAHRPRRRRRHEHRPRVRDLLRDRLAGHAGHRACRSARSSRARPRPRRASSPATRSSRVNGEALRVLRRRTVVDALRGTPARPSTLDVRHADGTAATVDGHASRPPAELSRDARRARRRPARAVVSGVRRPRRRQAVAIAIASELVPLGRADPDGLGDLVDGIIKDPTAPPPAPARSASPVSLADLF